MKSAILLLLFALLPVFSQEEQKPSENSVEKPQSKIEAGFRWQKSAFIPFEYDRIARSAGMAEYYSGLKGNEKTVIPLLFRYFNFEKKYAVEFQFTRFNLQNPSYIKYYSYEGIPSQARSYLIGTQRDDYKLNYLFLNPFENTKSLSPGFGIRKIDRSRIDCLTNSILEERIATQGLQFVLKNKFTLYENLDLNTGLEIYYTQGRRDYHYQTAFNYIPATGGQHIYASKTFDSNKTMGTYRGMELDISLSYLFYQNYKLYLGLNYNKSFFRYRNFSDESVNYNSANNQFGYTHYYGRGGKDDIKGIYFGLSFVF